MNTCRYSSPAGLARVGSPSQTQPTLAPLYPLDRAYELFQQGRDTFDIARALGITEARAHKRITLERDRLNGTQTEFEGRLS